MVRPWLTIYVGNLPEDAAEPDLERLFGEFGEVRRVTLMHRGRSTDHRGFGFVEMPSAAARSAIAELDGLQWRGRLLRVNQSRDRGAPAPRRAY